MIDVTNPPSGPAAVPFDGTDDTAAFENALELAGHNDFIYVPGGKYHIKRMLEPKLLGPSGCRMVGVAHSGKGSLLVVNDMPDSADDQDHVPDPDLMLDAVIKVSHPHSIQLENITIDCNGKSKRGIWADRAAGSSTRLVNVKVQKSTEVAFYFDRCGKMHAQSLNAHVNQGDGIWIKGCNAANFVNTMAQGNDKNGVLIDNVAEEVIDVDGVQETIPTHSGGCHLIGGTVENNRGHGIVISTQSLTSVSNFWLERNDGDSIRIENAKHINVHDTRILGGGHGVNFLAVDSDGNVYVASQSTNEILRYDKEGNPLGMSGEPGDAVFVSDGSEELTWLASLAFDLNGVLHVGSKGSNKVLVFDNVGNFIAGSFYDGLVIDKPKRLVFDNFGNLYLIEEGTSDILKYTPSDSSVFVQGIKAIRLVNSHNCRIRDNAISNGNTDTFGTISADIDSIMNEFTGNTKSGIDDGKYRAIKSNNRSIGQVRVHTNNFVQNPIADTWKQGDIAWNKEPDVNTPIGWVCIKSKEDETLSVWKSFGRIQK